MSKIKIKLDGKAAETESGVVRVDDLYQQCGAKPDKSCLYLNRTGDIDVPLLPGDYMILHGGERILLGDVNTDIEANPPLSKPISIEFNGEKITEGIGTAKVTGSELCGKDNELESPRLFADLKGAVDVAIHGDMTLVLQDKDSFFTIPAADDGDDAIDLEECAKKERKPPKGQRFYKISVDKHKHKVRGPEITGAEILALVDKGYDAWTLNRKLRGGRRKPIAAEEVVDLAEPGIERFETVKRQAQQG